MPVRILLESTDDTTHKPPRTYIYTTTTTQNTEGDIGPFYLAGVKWIDGSVQADIPLRGVSTMFSVSNCVVSQVNFHVVLGMRMPGQQGDAAAAAGAEGEGEGWLLHQRRYWSLFKMLATDIKYRAISMRELGLFPTVFGQDISGACMRVHTRG